MQVKWGKDVADRRRTLAAVTNDPPMNDVIRLLIIEVADDDPRMLPVLHILNHFVRCQEMFKWCLKNKMRGARMFIWLKEEFNGSPLKMGRFILSRVEKDEEHAILLGRDWK